MIGPFLRSCRPKEWSKNLLLFAGVIFSHHVLEPSYLLRSLLGFLLFSATASSIYLLNDLMDREKDLAHPVKRRRPIASGRLPARAAWVGVILLAIPSLALGYTLWPSFGVSLTAYFALNFAYSFRLKHIVILDVMAISIGFLIRAIAGVQVLHAVDPSVLLSPWLLVCTFFASLFVAVCKRRSELILLSENAGEHRSSLDHYSPVLTNQMITLTAAATVLSFSLYTIWPDTVEKFGTERLIYTVPFVVYGLFRYMYLVLERGMGGNPADLLFSDHPLLLNILLWTAAVLAILYV
ncbi:MAG: decaprenyl-phosphate phosphoribosyltransferase [Candidatus Eisenbacteria bacterium]|nr:decaprenyl-phosphate phosphoribosyltransferase [Candidatus Eisenbacteria bacterium]